MRDYAGYCRQRLRACFLRRAQFPLGSEARAACIKQARAFLRYYRDETGRARARSLALDSVDSTDRDSVARSLCAAGSLSADELHWLGQQRPMAPVDTIRI